MNRIICLVAAGLLLAGGCAVRAPGGRLSGDRAAPAAVAVVTDGDFLTVPEGFQPPEPMAVARRAPEVLFAAYPLPHDRGRPWSHWGTGLVHSSGRVYTAVGDHLSVGANTFLYEYDPPTARLRLVADLFSAVAGFDPEENYGFGKVHGRLSEGRDGNIYLAGGTGSRSRRELFKGSHLFRYDPRRRTLADLGRPLFAWNAPSTHLNARDMLFYAEVHLLDRHYGGVPPDYREPFSDSFHQVWRFLVYDLEKQRVIYHGGKENAGHGRAFFIDGRGNAYFNNGDQRLQKYCVATNTVGELGLEMPGTRIRRTAGPDAAGRLYATMVDSRVLWRFDPEAETATVLMDIGADCPGLAMDHAGGYLYLVPGGKDAARWGTPLIQFDLETGARKVIAFLGEPVWRQHGFHLGGTYNVMCSPDGATVYIGFNGLAGSRERNFGDQAFVAVRIPTAERRR